MAWAWRVVAAFPVSWGGGGNVSSSNNPFAVSSAHSHFQGRLELRPHHAPYSDLGSECALTSAHVLPVPGRVRYARSALGAAQQLLAGGLALALHH